MIRVLLASPLPPPEGGIAKWTTLILGVRPPADVARHHFDTAVHGHYHFGSPMTLRRARTQVQIILHFFWRCWRVRPDVLHLTSSYDGGWTRDVILLEWARALGAATIINLRGGDFERFYRGVSPRRQVRIRRTLSRCSAIVPITGEAQSFLRDLGLQNVSIIPNCIVLTPVRTRLRRVAAQPAPWRWLFVGWVMAAKGVIELLDALRAIPDSTLTIIGPVVKQGDTDIARVIRDALGDPTLTGRLTHVPGMPIHEIAGVYPEHDLFVFPTHREGFPNVVLEAMEAGVPIVASRVGAIPEMVRHEREALLVPARDSAALVSAIRRLQNDPTLADTLAGAARRRAESEYGVQAVSEAWFSLYRQVALHGVTPR